MKVYIVTCGSYSDYHIDNVFSTEQHAMRYAEIRNAASRYGPYNVESYDVDAVKVADGVWWEIFYSDNRIAVEPCAEPGEDDEVRMFIQSKTLNDAMKIAVERLGAREARDAHV